MILSVHQPQYIPWLGYFDKIARSDAFVFLDCVQYKAREYQNRNRIRRKGGSMWLTVPVVSNGRQPIREVLIDNAGSWQRQHLGSLSTWYGGAPFFKEHYPFFEDALSRKWDRLSELNVHIIRYLLESLSIATPLFFESQLTGVTGMSTRRIVEICKAMKADTYLSGTGGKGYLEEGMFDEAGIGLRYQEFIHPEYEQRFKPFEPFMSAVDLLFNHGPRSRQILIKD
ncbi:MAG: WbqC family protein [Deltaproteobacteria bacterium]